MCVKQTFGSKLSEIPAPQRILVKWVGITSMRLRPASAEQSSTSAALCSGSVGRPDTPILSAWAFPRPKSTRHDLRRDIAVMALGMKSESPDASANAACEVCNISAHACILVIMWLDAKMSALRYLTFAPHSFDIGWDIRLCKSVECAMTRWANEFQFAFHQSAVISNIYYFRPLVRLNWWRRLSSKKLTCLLPGEWKCTLGNCWRRIEWPSLRSVCQSTSERWGIRGCSRRRPHKKQAIRVSRSSLAPPSKWVWKYKL